jgi:hypothetical protein
LDEVIKEDVILLKIDVECIRYYVMYSPVKAYEVRALLSALPALKKYYVPNILVEWFPKRWKWSNVSVDQGSVLLETLSDMGYRIFHYNLRLEYNVTNLSKLMTKAGYIWEIPRDKIRHMHSFLMDNNQVKYGEANLWLSKDILTYLKT